MRVLKLEFTLRVAWAQSLKDRRGVIKSLVAKLQNNFGVSAAELGEGAELKTLRVGVAAICASAALADALAARIERFVEDNFDAELVEARKSYE